MSFAFDVNLLIYASDSGSTWHTAARALLEEKAQGREIFCLAWPTALSYLRIVTHPGILGRPLQPDEALGNLRTLAALPHVRMLAERDGFLDAYAEVTGGEPIRGKLVPDAHLAAILLQHDVRMLYTADADFHRFRFLDVHNPFAA
jgi:hypothetical protein